MKARLGRAHCEHLCKSAEDALLINRSQRSGQTSPTQFHSSPRRTSRLYRSGIQCLPACAATSFNDNEGIGQVPRLVTVSEGVEQDDGNGMTCSPRSPAGRYARTSTIACISTAGKTADLVGLGEP